MELGEDHRSFSSVRGGLRWRGDGGGVELGFSRVLDLTQVQLQVRYRFMGEARLTGLANGPAGPHGKTREKEASWRQIWPNSE
jgi:hypothetical protein